MTKLTPGFWYSSIPVVVPFIIAKGVLAFLFGAQYDDGLHNNKHRQPDDAKPDNKGCGEQKQQYDE